MTRFKWTSFYQEFEVPVYKFLFKAAVLIVTTRDGGHIRTEIKNTILSYPSTTQDMVESHRKILWDNNSGAVLGIHSTSDYGATYYEPSKQAIFTQQKLRFK